MRRAEGIHACAHCKGGRRRITGPRECATGRSTQGRRSAGPPESAIRSWYFVSLNITVLFLFEGLGILPSVDDGSGIDFSDAFVYARLEFIEGLYPDMPQKGSSHFTEQSLDDVQPGAVLRRQDVLKTVGVRGEKRLRLL